MPSSPVDICIVTGGHWSVAKGGAPYQAFCLSERLMKKRNVRVSYVARGIDLSHVDQRHPMYRVGSPSFLHRLGFFVDCPWLYRRLQAIRPQLIYQRGHQAYTGLCALYARRASCKFVYHIASDYDVLPLSEHKVKIHSGFRILEKRMAEFGLRNADRIIAQSFHQAELLEKNYGLVADDVVRNFHDAPASLSNKPTEPIEVVWVGNLKPLKRPELFVELAEKLGGDTSVRFTMVGAGLDAPRYQGLKARMEAGGIVHYVGAVDQSRVNEILSRAHVLVCTSESEGFPNTFIQAWLRGAVVVSLGINPDRILTEMGVGICCDNTEQLSRAVADLCGNRELRQKIGCAARHYALKAHSMANADRLADSLTELAEA